MYIQIDRSSSGKMVFLNTDMIARIEAAELACGEMAYDFKSEAGNDLGRLTVASHDVTRQKLIASILNNGKHS